MSDQRPEWMPSARGLRHAVRGLDLDPIDGVAELMYRTGLRAQIAVLEELISGCDINEAGQTVVFTHDLRDKIEELRKELA